MIGIEVSALKDEKCCAQRFYGFLLRKLMEIDFWPRKKMVVKILPFLFLQTMSDKHRKLN